MPEPNFSESQLQQSINTAIIRRILELHGSWYPAFVPSLPEELLLGWDTAFSLPWLRYAPHPDHKGCNMFLQYKLADRLTTPNAKEWNDWGCEYYRFTIPHNTQDASGQYFKDFHQWDRLKALANQSYPTYYATNSFLLCSVLHNLETAGILLDHIPFLDVRITPDGHHHVTFTETSFHFYLHSKKEKQKKLSFAMLVEQIQNEKSIPLDKANERLISSLKQIDTQDAAWKEDLAALNQVGDFTLPQRYYPVLKFHQLRSFVSKHIGARLIWYPTEY